MSCENPKRIRNPRYRGMSDQEAYDFWYDRYSSIIDWENPKLYRSYQYSGCTFKTSILCQAPDLYIEVPCCLCRSCQKSRLNGYRIRLLSELERSSRSLFVTLTFNDDYLAYLNDQCGGNYNKPVLQFLDNLRKKYGKGIRHWFICEFGKLHGRPHYHGILFNVPESVTADDVIDSWNRHRQGSRSKKRSQWDFASTDRGICYIGSECNQKTGHYITKYLTKDWSYGLTVPRVISSRGLGENYVKPEVVLAHHRDGLRPYITTSAGYYVSLPRYLKSRIFTKEDLASIQLDSYLDPNYFYAGRRFGSRADMISYRKSCFERNVSKGLSLTQEQAPPVKPRKHKNPRLLMQSIVPTEFLIPDDAAQYHYDYGVLTKDFDPFDLIDDSDDLPI